MSQVSLWRPLSGYWFEEILAAGTEKTFSTYKALHLGMGKNIEKGYAPEKGLKMSEIDRLTKLCAQERAARKQAEDMLEQKSLELYDVNQDLREREETSRTILETTGDGIIIVDEAGVIKMLNRAAKVIFGCITKSVVGHSVDELLDAEGDENFLFYLEASEHEPVNTLHETYGIHSDGTRIPIEINITKANVPDHDMVIISVRDIAARRASEQEWEKMEMQLRHAQKLEAIGQLAAGIAHEINTPIQFIGDNMRFIKEAFDGVQRLYEVRNKLIKKLMQGEMPHDLIEQAEQVEEKIDFEYLRVEAPKAIQQSLDGIRRVEDIVRSMKEFSHPGVEEKILVDINSAIESTVTVSRNEWKYYAEMQLNLDPSLPMVPCRPGDLNQAILNIVVNAAHAIREKQNEKDEAEIGVITVSTSKSASGVKIEVSDTGIGISDNILPRIFDPFFTTKEVGKGTGQGLAITYSAIVDKHGGSIDVKSQIGVGSTFTIILPLND